MEEIREASSLLILSNCKKDWLLLRNIDLMIRTEHCLVLFFRFLLRLQHKTVSIDHEKAKTNDYVMVGYSILRLQGIGYYND